MVVLVAKFVEGAWITALLVALMIVFMHMVKRHYVRVDREIYLDRPIHAGRGAGADRGGSHRSLEPDYGEGFIVRALHVE